MLLGIDIGGTSMKAGVFDEDINLIKKYHIPFGDETLSPTFPKLFIEKLYDLIEQSTSEFADIKSIGCGVPGVVSNDGIIAVAPNLNGIVDFPLRDYIQSKTSLPLALDNDANVAALAELKIGSGVNLDYFIYITLGTGIGGAIISNGQIFRGSSGGAGEIGHCIIDYTNSEFDKRPYRIGALEVFSGREGILRLANQTLQKFKDSALNRVTNFDVEDISNFAESGDQACIEIINITAERIGVALANSANILDIPTFVIGGGISQSKILLSKIEMTLKSRSIPSIAKRAKVIPAKFIQDTGIFGAAVLAKFYSN